MNTEHTRTDLLNSDAIAVMQHAPLSEQNSRVQEDGVVLPVRKYGLKMVLLFSDVWLLLSIGYYHMIHSIQEDIARREFSWISLRMISTYIVLGITAAVVIGGIILKQTHSIRTRISRDNDLRQDPNINVWLTTFDWTWLMLFVPTMILAVLCGATGYIINWAIADASIAATIHHILGGVTIGFFCLNAAVVIFKITPTRILLLAVSIVAFSLILLLMGVDVFLNVFGKFRHLGITIDPFGYLLIAYAVFFFLRIIWIDGLFNYIAIAPNRLDIQRGLSESERGIQRKDFRVSIDTEDVILRLFKIGRIIISFPQSDRLPLCFLVTRIDKKAGYAMEAASVISIGRKELQG